MANANNLIKARQRILQYIKLSGDDGVGFYELASMLGMKSHGVLSHLGALIKQGSIRRHPQYNHYFYIDVPSPYLTSNSPNVTAVDPNTGVKFSNEFSPYEEHLFNKFLARLGLQVK
jgi:hypothetical protein